MTDQKEHGSAQAERQDTSRRGALSELFWLASPLIASHVGNQLIGLVDASILGRYSEVAQGAAGLGNNLFFAVAVLGMGVMMSLEPLISQSIGAKQMGRSRSLLWQGFWLASVVVMVLSLVLVAMPVVVLPLFGLDPETTAATRTFLWARAPGLWPLLLSSATRGYLQATGKTSAMLWSMLAANLMNAVLASFLVFGSAPFFAFLSLPPLDFLPPLGVFGAALSANLCGLLQLGVLFLFVRRIEVSEPFSRRPQHDEIKKAVRVGVPVGLQMFAEVGAFALAGLLAGGFGTVPLAAHQIALNWASFTFSMALGISSAGAVLVGRAVGAQDIPRARRSGVTALITGGAAMGMSSMLFLFAPKVLAGTLSNNPEVIACTISLFGVAAVFQVFDGMQVVGAGVLRGAGDTKMTFWVNVFGHYAVGLPLGVALGVWAGMGVTGLWWGLCAGLITVGVLLFWRFLRISSRHIARL